MYWYQWVANATEIQSDIVLAAVSTATTDSTTASVKTWELIDASVKDFADLLWPAVIALASVGILAMALIEAGKTVFRIRRRFHQYRFRDFITFQLDDWDSRKSKTSKKSRKPTKGWLKRRQQAFLSFFRLLPHQKRYRNDNKFEDRVDEAIAEIIRLATAGDKDALFDLPVARLTGQLNAAGQTILTYPKTYKDLIPILAGLAERNDIKKVQEGPPPSKKDPKPPYHEAIGRIADMMQRNLDAIQITWGNQWARMMHWSSVALSFLIIFVAGMVHHYEFYNKGDVINPKYEFFSIAVANPDPLDRLDFFYWVMIAFFGAVVAPVAKDLVSALKEIRSRARP